jgi:hypothetical protein
MFPHYWTAQCCARQLCICLRLSLLFLHCYSSSAFDNYGFSTASAIMSKVTEMVNDATLQKTLPETSAREPDGIDDQDVNRDDYHDYLGVTRNDRRDMARMGKIQQLRVSGTCTTR